MSNYISTNILSSSNIDTASSLQASAVLIPLQLKDAEDSTINIDQATKQYSDGYILNKAQCFVDLKDVKHNSDSLVWLTNSQTYNNVYIEGTTLRDISDYIDTFGFVYTYIRTQPDGSDTTYYLGAANTSVNVTTDTESASIAKISKTDTGKYNIQFNGLYLTVNPEDYSVALSALVLPDSSLIQDVNISIQNGGLTIYVDDGEYKRYIGVNSALQISAFGIYAPAATTETRYDTTSILTPSSTTKNRRYLFELYFENLDSGYSFGPHFESSTAWNQYYNELSNKTDLKNVDINTEKSIKAVPVNHLFISPYNASVDVDNKTIAVNHLPLKNMMTPEQNYTLTPHTEDINTGLPLSAIELTPKRREYNKIFSEDSSSGGYDKMMLTFTSNTKLQVIESEGESYFHYPLESDQIPLSSAGFIEAGAIPGSTPFNADRIYKKNAKYQDFTNWGQSQQIFGCDDGSWLCAWLSGSEGSSLSGMENSVWVDRWYDPSKITIGDALALGRPDIQTQINTPEVFDVPSELTLDPGVYYKYDRVSNTRLDNIVSTFNVNDTSLRLHYQDDWEGTAVDQSSYGNDGTILRYTPDDLLNIGPAYQKLDQTALTLSDGRYIDIPYSNSTELTGSHSLMLWTYSDNWVNNPGSSLMSTNFRGGVSIDYNKHFFNPIVSVIEDTYGHALLYSLCSPIADARVPTSTTFKTLDEATDIIVVNPPSPTTTGSVSGTLCLDINGDGVKDPEDTPIEGSVIMLTNLLGTVGSTTTDVSGQYIFTDISDGAYTIRQLDLPEYYSTTSNLVNINIASDVSQIDFLDAQYATISGTLYLDVDGDGVIDVEDVDTISGSTITLYTTSGAEYSTTTTDVSGQYVFSEVEYDTYNVTQTDLFTYYSTTSSTVVGVVSSTTPVEVNFLDTQYATVTGTVYEV